MSNLLYSTNQGLILYKTIFEQESVKRSDDCYKLIFSIGGSTKYQLPNQDIELQQNQLLLLNPNYNHKQLYVEGPKFVIELNPQYLQPYTQQNDLDLHFAQTPMQITPVTNWVAFITDYIKMVEGEDDPSLAFFLDNSFTQLTVLLMKMSIHSHNHDIFTDHHQTHYPQLYKVIQALKESYSSNWNLDDMANLAEMDKYHFSHLFKEMIGISPYSWLQLFRIQRSLEMLKYSNQTILMIALACGFSSISIYNRFFKKVYGMTPTFFRNSLNK
ncbi:helix-turn-helix transcriptional regulator [Alkalihalobacillus trypoxylicola]|uniref:HTH araC/xylS-type domain-containing protein n=1 Tax=Alkalihalobacillus trypoxylicola TaxID=519424 RepID=A0A161P3H6_9BACI|nr:AraC family transcriptional regulator [Alkalihalobacillus trypoxylicola]KYG26083.1 hypothetical protein AZF04_13440 [Alkalihalobacillus trypoxylicola]